ncbi:DUF222 domain-containing protein [Actinoplanes sp. M2I2]|uniref:HNH endonuclease signature motif containing protein n=1 Tax=Actinoplanes sp. M2I2 TaxID=1734444 RepID=UPI0035B43B5B
MADVRQLSEDAAKLAAAPLWPLGDDELTACLKAAHRVEQCAAALQARLVQQTDARGLPAAQGHRNTASWLRSLLLIDPQPARELAGQAAALSRHPAVETAVLDGRLNLRQSTVIGATLDALSEDLAHHSDSEAHSEHHGGDGQDCHPHCDGDRDSHDGCQRHGDGRGGELGERQVSRLVELARTTMIGMAERLPAYQLRRVGERILAYVAPELAERADEAALARQEARAYRRRGLTLSLPVDGLVRLSGLLGTEDAALMHAALHPLCTPTPGDDRTAEHRRADALIDICRLALRTGELPTDGGEPPQLAVTVAYDLLTRLPVTGIQFVGVSNTDTSSTGISSTRIPHMGTPDTRTPHMGTPDTRTPHIGTPDTHTPHIGTGIPHIGTPHVGTPGVGTPSVGTLSVGTLSTGNRTADALSADALADAPNADALTAGALTVDAPNADVLRTGTLSTGTLGIGTLGIGTLGIGTLGIGTLGIGTLGIGTLGIGTTDTGQRLSAAAMRRLACDARILPFVLGGAGQILDTGRARRLATGPLRRALHVRDRGCAFPDCDRPPRWTDAHHLTAWSNGGPTSLDNLVLLCRHHHRLVHHPGGGWQIRLGPDQCPDFYPPPTVDPLRRPRRNLYHRPASLRGRPDPLGTKTPTAPGSAKSVPSGAVGVSG